MSYRGKNKALPGFFQRFNHRAEYIYSNITNCCDLISFHESLSLEDVTFHLIGFCSEQLNAFAKLTTGSDKLLQGVPPTQSPWSRDATQI